MIAEGPSPSRDPATPERDDEHAHSVTTSHGRLTEWSCRAPVVHLVGTAAPHGWTVGGPTVHLAPQAVVTTPSSAGVASAGEEGSTRTV